MPTQLQYRLISATGSQLFHTTAFYCVVFLQLCAVGRIAYYIYISFFQPCLDVAYHGLLV